MIWMKISYSSLNRNYLRNLGEVIGLIPSRLYTETESKPREYFASPW